MLSILRIILRKTPSRICKNDDFGIIYGEKRYFARIPEQKSMKKFHSEIVICVSDLDVCRHFYRTVLEMGDPVFDSNFITSFQVGDDLFFTLARTGSDNLERARSAMTWRFEVKDLERLRGNCASAGRKLLPPGKNGTYWCGIDPEGNRFYVREFR